MLGVTTETNAFVASVLLIQYLWFLTRVKLQNQCQKVPSLVYQLVSKELKSRNTRIQSMLKYFASYGFFTCYSSDILSW